MDMQILLYILEKKIEFSPSAMMVPIVPKPSTNVAVLSLEH